MGYKVKIQKVDRPTNRSYYVNLPVALAESIDVEKGEEFEWIVEDRNTLVLQRSEPRPSVRKKNR
jgi:antitoxin component of MazEF toxin-antitoxin module